MLLEPYLCKGEQKQTQRSWSETDVRRSEYLNMERQWYVESIRTACETYTDSTPQHLGTIDRHMSISHSSIRNGSMEYVNGYQNTKGIY